MENASPSARRRLPLVTAAVLTALLALAIVLTAGGGSVTAAGLTGQSVIVLIGDGMGPAQRTLTQLTRYGPYATQPMDSLDVAGSLTTLPFGKPGATDSAASATAMATGEKTRNNYAGVGPSGNRLRTLLEIARDEGKSTGLVEDNDVTNATMAGFAAHVDSRVFTMEATLGSPVYGILSNPYLDRVAQTTHFEVTVTLEDDGSFSYDETTTVTLARYGGPLRHTDRNTLKRVD